jgi:glutamine synthetase
MRVELMKDSTSKLSLFKTINNAIKLKDYKTASEKQKEMNDKMTLIRSKYTEYRRNII